MNPDLLVEDEKNPTDLKSIMDTNLNWYHTGKRIREPLVSRAALNQKIMKGIPIDPNTSTVSKITGRQKVFFRKVWASAWRILASLYQAYLQDKNKFKVIGREGKESFIKAKILEKLAKARLYRMLRRHSAFTKLLWAFMDCISPGVSVIKMFWKYNEEQGIDEPDFIVYPLDQVVLDWDASTPQEMEFTHFENYLSKNKLEELGYDNLDKIMPTKIPTNPLRSTRYSLGEDPNNTAVGGSGYDSGGAVGNAYPDAQQTGEYQESPNDRFLAVESFYKKKGKIYYCVFEPNSKTWLKKPKVSPYGKIYPIAVGSMLLEAHKLVPEGLPQVLEGPQESMNFTLNLRKDNQLLSMSGGFIYGKFGGVDRQALRNIKPGFTVGANDVTQVAPIKVPDVTSTAYAETSADEGMMDELGGVNQTKRGESTASKSGVAQINFLESNAKIDLYTAIVGQTLFHQFCYILVYMVQLFETNETSFKEANQMLRDEGVLPSQIDNIYDVEFDADVEVDVGVSEVSRNVLAQRQALMWDRMLQSNQATFQLLQAGIQIQNPKIFDLGELAKDIAPNYGIDNIEAYLVPVAPPPPQQQEGGQPQATAGQNAAQPNEVGQDDTGFIQSIQQQLGG